MTETIRVKVDESLARKFKKKAMERYGYKKGSIKKALEEAMRRYATERKAHWGALVGTLKLDKDSVWLQHHAWDKID